MQFVVCLRRFGDLQTRGIGRFDGHRAFELHIRREIFDIWGNSYDDFVPILSVEIGEQLFAKQIPNETFCHRIADKVCYPLLIYEITKADDGVYPDEVVQGFDRIVKEFDDPIDPVASVHIFGSGKLRVLVFRISTRDVEV